MTNALEVENVSKRYQLGESRGSKMLREVLTGFFKNPLRAFKGATSIHWALKNVSFTVRPGEVLGIIGRNGAGKSTLLKVLSKISYPTVGHIKVNGRVASLLEVGTGFHEELTGRENIYLNGSIMGMKKKEINARIEEIATFAMTEKFLDTPIKRYSSGMRLRLGFAVAAHLDPDILLVDEVLAVGDAEFQKRCLKAMDDLRGGGRTVLFVSHNMAAVENLCNRTIWIDQGEIREDGPTSEVIHAYMSTFSDAGRGGADLENIETRCGNGGARFTRVEFLDSENRAVEYIRSGDRVCIRFHFRVFSKTRDFRVGVEFRTELGLMLCGTNNWATGLDVPPVNPGEGHMDLEIDLLNFLPGRYYLSLFLGTHDNLQDVIQNCVMMDVEPSDYYKTGRGIESRFGLVFLPCRWKSNDLPIDSIATAPSARSA